VECGRESPTSFKGPLNRRRDRAVNLVEADLSDEAAGVSLLHSEETEAHVMPHPGAVHEPSPRLLTCGWYATDKANHFRIAPERMKGFNIFDVVGPEPQPFRLDDRYRHAKTSAGSRDSLLTLTG
jgi:hypothetical protein